MSYNVWLIAAENFTQLALTMIAAALCIRAGVFNLGIEAMFAGGAVGAALWLYAHPGGMFGAVVTASVVGLLVGVLFALCAVWQRFEALTVGIAINMLGWGASGWLVYAVTSGGGFTGLTTSNEHTLWAIGGLILVGVIGILAHLLLEHSRFYPAFASLETSLDVARQCDVPILLVQSAAVVGAGMLAALGGAFNMLPSGSLSIDGIWTAGFGFMALAIAMGTRGRIGFGLLVTALCAALPAGVQASETLNSRLPNQVVHVAPALVIITVLLLTRGRRHNTRSADVSVSLAAKSAA